MLVNIELRHERNAKPGPPGARSAPIVNEDVRLQRAEALLAHLGADRLYAVQAGDLRACTGSDDLSAKSRSATNKPGYGREACRRGARGTARRALWPWRRAARSRWRRTPRRQRLRQPDG